MSGKKKRIIRVIEVLELTGLSYSTIYRMERAGTFPKKHQLSLKTIGWDENSVLEWVDNPEAWRNKNNKELAA